MGHRSFLDYLMQTFHSLCGLANIKTDPMTTKAHPAEYSFRFLLVSYQLAYSCALIVNSSDVNLVSLDSIHTFLHQYIANIAWT